MHIRRLAFVLSILMFFASVAEAAAGHRDPDRDRGRDRPRSRDRDRDVGQSTGAYLGGSFSLGVEQFDNMPPEDDFDEGFGFDVWVGSRIHRHVGVEGQLSYLKGFEIRGTGIDFNHLNGTANLKLYPLDGRIQPYVMAGAGLGRFEVEEPDGYTLSDTGGVMRVGAGVDVYLNESIALVGGLGYLFTAGDIVDTDIVEMRFGVQYRF